MTLTIHKGETLTVKANVIPGINETVNLYEWIVDSINIQNNTDTTTLYTALLTTGQHEISFRAQNSCGNYSDYITLTFNITEDGELMYITGTTTIPNGIQYIDITHNLGRPNYVTVTPMSSRGRSWNITNKTNNSFRLNMSTTYSQATPYEYLVLSS